MVSTRSRARKASEVSEALDNNNNPKPNPILHTLQSIFSSIQSPHGLKPQLLKSLYYVLVTLSVDTPISRSNSGTVSNHLGIKFSDNASKAALQYLCNISNIIFRELSTRFIVFSALRDFSDVHSNSQSNMQSLANELNLILRCCLVILNLLESDANLLSKKCQILLAILGRLCYPDLFCDDEKNSFSFKKSLSHEGTYGDDFYITSYSVDFIALGFLEHSDPRIPFLCEMLEVFLDELLVHRSLRQCFLSIDSRSPASKMMFVRHPIHADSGIVLEVISAHFLLSVSDEQAFEKRLNRLFCLHEDSSTIPELCMDVSVSLLHNAAMFSIPKFLQAHIMTIVSESTRIDMAPENIRPDIRLTNSCISTFERSVVLYNTHIVSMRMDDTKCSFPKSYSLGNAHPSLEFYIHAATRNRIDSLVTKVDSLWHPYTRKMFFQTKTDLLAASFTFIKENECILDVKYKNDISSVLRDIICRVVDDISDTHLNEESESSAWDVFFLASVLKLMGRSMLQAVWCMKHIGEVRCLRSSKLSSCKEYDCLVDAISSFKNLNVHLPIEKFLDDVMGSHPTSNKGSKVMLLHFFGLLSLCFHSGYEFLAKGCIFVMMGLMNLFAFEKDVFDELRPSLFFGSKYTSYGFFPSNVCKVAEDKSSLIIASNFQKTQALLFSKDYPTSVDGILCNKSDTFQDASTTHEAIASVTEETCNGEIFLECILEGHKKSNNVDDLSDFIECKAGRDYACWMKTREKYRKHKGQKMAVLRWKKMKKSWSFVKGKNPL